MGLCNMCCLHILLCAGAHCSTAPTDQGSGERGTGVTPGEGRHRQLMLFSVVKLLFVIFGSSTIHNCYYLTRSPQNSDLYKY